MDRLRESKKAHIEDKGEREFHGLLDTGADVSVISSQYWPLEWPLIETDISITGIGGISQPGKSMWTLKCFGLGGQVGQI